MKKNKSMDMKSGKEPSKKMSMIDKKKVTKTIKRKST